MPVGRPKIQIDKTQFEKLCGLQCTKDEIAGFFNCSEDTIKRYCKNTYKADFASVFKKYSANGKISLRRYQFKLAEKNASMAIWLGKQMLGQTDDGNRASDGETTSLLESINKVLHEDINGLES